MSSLLGFLSRLYPFVVGASAVPKKGEPVKIGILGAAKIAPLALIDPARNHAEVVVQAVAARDKSRATAFAKKHGIPQVLDSYQAVIDDPNVDAVYIPLPNGLHYEWALRALAAGKHVLLEKPTVSNAQEAEILFRHQLLQQPSPPVLVEAFHYRFQPCWAAFLSLLDPPNVAHARAKMIVPKSVIAEDDVRFNFALAGGAMMDLGTYPCSAVRISFGGEPPVECTSAEFQPCPPPRERCDHAFKAAFRFANGGTAEVEGSLSGALMQLPDVVSKLWVEHRPVVVPDAGLPDGQEKVRTRRLYMANFMLSFIWHRIDVEDEYVVRKVGEQGTQAVLKRWVEKESRKAYTWAEAGVQGRGGEASWTTYRHQLEAFVDRVKARPGTGMWIEHEDSIKQAQMLDMAYEKSGMGLRPTSDFRLSK